MKKGYIVFFIIVVILFLFGITKSIKSVRKITCPTKVNNTEFSNNIPNINSTVNVTYVSLNIEKEKEEFKKGVYFGSRAILELVKTGKQNLNDNEIYNSALNIRKQAEGGKK